MNTIRDTRNQLAGPWFVTAIFRMCLAVPRALARDNRLQRERAHLSRLPDYLLRDIGISRCEIASITLLGGTDESRRPRG
jgi:uncharacterized protein YjiS (DUF1127 family)